jgi:UTP--glucose-1-phosphate uridylyltransferase
MQNIALSTYIQVAMMTSPKRLRKAVFPVGGLGTRFLPATKSLPKEMLPVASKPLIQYAFEEAVAAGIEEFIFITGRNKNAISNHFDHSYELQNVLTEKEKADELFITRGWLPDAGHIAFVRQQEPLGLGHAVWCARNFIGEEPFAVLLADEMMLVKGGFLKQMAENYHQHGGNHIAVADVAREHTSRYGIIDPETDDGGLIKIRGMVEKPKPENAPSTLSITGRYILQPEIFSYLEQGKRGSGNEIQLTDAMAQMLGSSPFYGVRCNGRRFDCGSQLGFLEANIAYALEQESMREQVREMLKKYSEY